MNHLVALVVPPGELFVDLLKRCWDEGNAVLPVDVRLPVPAVNALLDELQPSVVIDAEGNRTERNGVPIASDVALVVATSGTTGTPKGVVLSHNAVRASAEMTSQRLAVNATDHWLACLPVAHIGGLSVITRALLSDIPLTILPKFDVASVEQAAKNGATLVSLVTAAMRQIDTSLFRTIVLGGGPVPPDKPSNAVVTYGMTETGSGIVYDGIPLSGAQVRIDDGQIFVKSPTLFSYYRSKAWPEGMDPKIDGWFATGDAGCIEQDGTLSVLGRMGEMINTGGEKVWPMAVENVLRSHPKITEALVQGQSDAKWGQRVVARLELTDDVPLGLEEVREYVKQYLPAYCAPHEVRFEQLKRTALGKVIRNPSAG